MNELLKQQTGKGTSALSEGQSTQETWIPEIRHQTSAPTRGQSKQKTPVPPLFNYATNANSAIQVCPAITPTATTLIKSGRAKDC